MEYPPQGERAVVVADADHRSPDSPEHRLLHGGAAFDQNGLLAPLHLRHSGAVLVQKRVDAARFDGHQIGRVGVAVREAPGDMAVAAGDDHGDARNRDARHPVRCRRLRTLVLGFEVQDMNFRMDIFVTPDQRGSVPDVGDAEAEVHVVCQQG